MITAGGHASAEPVDSPGTTTAPAASRQGGSADKQAGRTPGHFESLGTGIYLWQDSPWRAQRWATDRFGDDAAVVVAMVSLDACLDLLNPPEEEHEEADVFIFFNDLEAHEFYDLVERSVDVVSAVEGVDRAVARRPGAGLRDGRRRPCNLERRASPLVGGAAQTKGAPARSARAAPCCGQSLRYRTPC